MWAIEEWKGGNASVGMLEGARGLAWTIGIACIGYWLQRFWSRIQWGGESGGNAGDLAQGGLGKIDI